MQAQNKVLTCSHTAHRPLLFDSLVPSTAMHNLHLSSVVYSIIPLSLPRRCLKMHHPWKTLMSRSIIQSSEMILFLIWSSSSSPLCAVASSPQHDHWNIASRSRQQALWSCLQQIRLVEHIQFHTYMASLDMTHYFQMNLAPSVPSSSNFSASRVCL